MESSIDSIYLSGSDAYCNSWEEMLQSRQLIIASNHTPVTFHKDENGEIQPLLSCAVLWLHPLDRRGLRVEVAQGRP